VSSFFGKFFLEKTSPDLEQKHGLAIVNGEWVLYAEVDVSYDD
jgi:hypothetical protein